MYKTSAQIADEILQRKDLEKQAVLARLYATGRGAIEAAKKVPRISVGGPRLAVKPVSARQAYTDVEKKFLQSDESARDYLTRKVSPKVFEGANVLFRMAGVPPKTRMEAAKRVATHSPLYLTAPLPAVPPFALHPIGQPAWTLGGPATTMAKRMLHIPTREGLLHKILDQRAKKRGFKNLEQRMLFEADPEYLPTKILSAIEMKGHGALQRIKEMGGQLSEADLSSLKHQMSASPGLSSVV